MSPSVALDFSNPDNYDSIQRGCFYLAVMPYHPKAPVKIFVPDDQDPNRGRLVTDPAAFDPDPNGMSPERFVIVTHKVRPVLVLQADGPNRSKSWKYVIVAPAYSFTDQDVGTGFYTRVRAGRMPGSLYIPAGVINDREGRVDLQDMLCIHKSMLRARITDTSFLQEHDPDDEAATKIMWFLGL